MPSVKYQRPHNDWGQSEGKDYFQGLFGPAVTRKLRTQTLTQAGVTEVVQKLLGGNEAGVEETRPEHLEPLVLPGCLS